MAVSLRPLDIAVPGTVLNQEEVRDVFAAQPGLSRLGSHPSTGTRNRVYAREATDVCVRVGAGALSACQGIEEVEITHVITGRDLDTAGPFLQLDHFETVLAPVGEDAMAFGRGLTVESALMTKIAGTAVKPVTVGATAGVRPAPEPMSADAAPAATR